MLISSVQRFFFVSFFRCDRVRRPRRVRQKKQTSAAREAWRGFVRTQLPVKPLNVSKMFPKEARCSKDASSLSTVRAQHDLCWRRIGSKTTAEELSQVLTSFLGPTPGYVKQTHSDCLRMRQTFVIEVTRDTSLLPARAPDSFKQAVFVFAPFQTASKLVENSATVFFLRA